MLQDLTDAIAGPLHALSADLACLETALHLQGQHVAAAHIQAARLNLEKALARLEHSTESLLAKALHRLEHPTELLDVN